MSAGLLFFLLFTGQDVEPETPAKPVDASQFSPFTSSPRIGDQRATVQALSGYDQARGQAIFETTTRLDLYGPVAISAGADYHAPADALRPTFGLHVQVLSQARHGVDGSVSAVYDPIGLEGAAEMQLQVALARRFGRLDALTNLVYGQEIEETSQRHGEVRAAALYAVGARAHLGLDSRFRFDLDAGRTDHDLTDVKYDLLAGPVASYVLGRFILMAHTGVAAVQTAVQSSTGMSALGGLGASF